MTRDASKTPRNGAGTNRPLGTPVERDGHERQCTAQSRRSGKRCRAFAMKGTTVCRTHGGAAGQVRAAAERRRAEQGADDAIQQLWPRAGSAEPVRDPVAAMQQLAGALEGFIEAAGSQVNAALAAGTDQAPAFARLERGIAHLRRLLADMQRLGIADRATEIEADKVRLVALAVGRVFEVLGLTPEQRQLGTQTLLAELRAQVAREQMTVVRGELE